MLHLKWSGAATGRRSMTVSWSRKLSRPLSASVKSGCGGRSASMRSAWQRSSPSRLHRTSSSWSRRSIWSRHQPAWSAKRQSRRANRNSRWLWRTNNSSSSLIPCRSEAAHCPTRVVSFGRQHTVMCFECIRLLRPVPGMPSSTNTTSIPVHYQVRCVRPCRFACSPAPYHADASRTVVCVCVCLTCYLQE